MSYEQTVETISGNNLSQAWANALLKCYEKGGGVLSPAVVHFPAVGEAGEVETAIIRDIVDKYLIDPSKFIPNQSIVETVAGTIFPESVWLHSHGNRHTFFKIYKNMIPLIRRERANNRGIYFQRMIAYPSNTGDKEPINQLDHIISTWQSGNHRHSALQVGIFDPRTDHTHARQQGFPCLQQVSFHPNGSNGKDGLSVVAFYANQTLIEKAYGNYLGLHRLGLFMAKEMGIQLKEVICMASALKINNNLDRTNCGSLVKAIKAVLKHVGE